MAKPEMTALDPEEIGARAIERYETRKQSEKAEQLAAARRQHGLLDRPTVFLWAGDYDSDYPQNCTRELARYQPGLKDIVCQGDCVPVPKGTIVRPGERILEPAGHGDLGR